MSDFSVLLSKKYLSLWKIASSPKIGSNTKYLRSGPLIFWLLFCTDIHNIPPLTTGTSSIYDCSNSLMNWIAWMCADEDFRPVSGSLIILIYLDMFSISSVSLRLKLISKASARPDDSLPHESIRCNSASGYVRYNSLSSRYRILVLLVNSLGILPFGLGTVTTAPSSSNYCTIFTELLKHATCNGVPCRGLITSILVRLHNKSSSMIEGYILDAAIWSGAI